MELSVANVATAPIPPGATLLRRGRAAVCNLSPLPASSLHGSSSSSSFGGFCLRPRCSRLQSFCYASSVVSLQQMIEDSSDTVEGPVLVCETRTLQPVLSLANAREALISALGTLQSNAYLIPSGIVRLQVAFSVEVKALEWLQCQPHNEQLLPRIYFSPRQECGTYGQDVDGLKHVAGIGSALLVKGQKPFTLADLKYVKRFLSRDCPLIRAYGAIRFDADIEPSEEWKEFGVFLFTIPLVELCESSGYPILAVTVAWDGTLGRDFKDALSAAKGALFQVSDFVATKNMNPCVTNLSKEHTPSEQAWHGLIKDVLQILDSHENLEAASQEIDIKHAIYDLVGLSKVVLARRTKLVVDPAVEPLTLVSLLQEKNPNSYQFCIQLSNSSFIGSTPERLFYKVGTKIFSEAIAGTRACGITENKDRDLGLELLSSAKDHLEFNIVMESIKQKLEGICKNVKVDCYKDLIKQANIQHLYGSLVGELCDGISEFELLSELHPTPAVCGQPQKLAKRFLNKIEQFDRGMYSGPIGWISGERAEFVVAIRSALLENPPNLAAYNGASVVTQLFLFAGVGIVKGSEPSSEWKELDLKIQPFEGILQPISPLHDASNINALWSRLIIEECCRLGIVYFCIAPGSRSSPLAVAAAENFKAKCVSCVDERSLAFHALGYARGASKPAAVITTSGTAVSNLLPAVVEASEGCVPLVLLTADRPPELLQAGANQSIDQIKHFGSFVRYNTNLPPPSDEMQARVVVTTVDAAIFYATSSPKGPVHINISFREPLAGTVLSWSHSCLKGLERWALSSQPFTKYMTPTSEIIRQHQFLCTAMKEMSDLIDSASRGLILTGGLQRIEESRAVLLLAKHLGWPVVPDILSGIRIRHSSLIDEDEVPCVIDHFDHILLDEDIYESIKPDTVLQIGSCITSKRVSRFLEISQPARYILVEEHPFRHDPSHLLTHRVHGSVMEFVNQVITCSSPSRIQDYGLLLKFLSNVVGQEITFQIKFELALSEPYVARIVGSSLTKDSAFFIGNSMPVRDADMYCDGCILSTSDGFDEIWTLSGRPLRTAGNRGASGIDGVLSTAIGFAVGSQQRVILLLGDLSFLHDTNGLSLLSKRVGRPPVVVIVVNNSGGGIFSLLPIANSSPDATFTNYFTTPHDVTLEQLSLAHKINHRLVLSKKDLSEALQFVHQQQADWIIEVRSSVEENAEYHRYLQISSRKAVRRAFDLVQSTRKVFGQNFKSWTIKKATYNSYKFQMSANPTSSISITSNSVMREGFILHIDLCDCSTGYGEVAPLEGLHEETLQDAEEQLRSLTHLLQGVTINNSLALLNGSFDKWLSESLGIMPATIFPSVRCGLEMGILGALAASNGTNFAGLLDGQSSYKNFDRHQNSPDAQLMSQKIRICGLLDSSGSPSEMALSALQLVQQGFCTLKVKVARRVSPVEDAAVLLAIRKAVGPKVHLRADANQRWTLAQALEFASAVQGCGLQYLEEPVKNRYDLVKFCKETGLPVAVDESIDKNVEDLHEYFSDLRLAAVVIKPSSVGGFERAAMIVKWAQRNGMLAIISSAFESSVGLAIYAQFSMFVDAQHMKSISMTDNYKSSTWSNVIISPVAHGLGTYMWLQDDVVLENRFSVQRRENGVEVSMEDCERVIQNLVFNRETVDVHSNNVVSLHSGTHLVNSAASEFRFHVMDTHTTSETDSKLPVLVFLHGFLGNCRDWMPIMQALSVSHRCISVDLPGHGKTCLERERISNGALITADPFSMESIANAINTLLSKLTAKKVILVGYSMGARLALYMALRSNQKVCAAVIISGSPGLERQSDRRVRAIQDSALAVILQEAGLQSFVDDWYQKPMWKSLRSHPQFVSLKASRTQHVDVKSLAKILCSMSLGRQPSLWKDLADPPVPLLFVAGKNDEKFVGLAHKMYNTIDSQKLRKSATLEEVCSECACLRLEQQPKYYQIESGLSCHDTQKGSVESEETRRFLLEEALVLQSDKFAKRECKNCKFVNLLRLDKTGHSVHVENPCLLINGISKFVTQFMQTSKQEPKG